MRSTMSRMLKSLQRISPASGNRMIIRISIPVLLCVLYAPRIWAIDIAVDGNDSGRIYHGLGITSQGTSDAIYDYAEPYRSDILDFMFKPKFGMSFQRMRVEIGCGRNTTSGSEPPHATTLGEIANPVPRGIEFWLIDKAKNLNPNIELEACPWGYPGDYYPVWNEQQRADYRVSWIKCLKNNFGWNTDYVSGATNEAGYPKDWIKNYLRPTLDRAGFSAVKILVADGDQPGSWGEILNDFTADPAFKNVIDVLANHFTGDNAAPTPAAIACGKMLGNSELHAGSGNSWSQALSMASALNIQYARYKCSFSDQWYNVDAMLYGMYPDCGQMNAKWPWCGYYEVKLSCWAYAHSNQFIEPGWKYLDKACGYDAGDTRCNWVTLRDTASNNWSMIIVTNGSALNINAAIGGGLLSTGPLHVWKSDATNQFMQQPDITPANGSFTISCAAGSIYSITTTIGQQKGSKTIPPKSNWSYNLTDDYEGYAEHDMPRYHSDRYGSFEASTAQGRKCLKQICTGVPNDIWNQTPETAFPFPGNWNQISADVFIDSAPPCRVMLGVHNGDGSYQAGNSRYLQLKKDGSWAYVSYSRTQNDNALTSGTVSGFDGNAWHAMKVAISGGVARFYVDSNLVGSYAETNANFPHLRSSWHYNLFDNLFVGDPNSATLQAVKSVLSSQSSPMLFSHPFRSCVSIDYAGPLSGDAVIAIYSSAGALVKSLRSGTVTGSTYRFAWDGKTDNGAALPPGTYTCILTDRSGLRMSKNLVFLR